MFDENDVGNSPYNKQYPHGVHYLYDDADLVGSPKTFVGLANSFTQQEEVRRRRERDVLHKISDELIMSTMNSPFFGNV